MSKNLNDIKFILKNIEDGSYDVSMRMPGVFPTVVCPKDGMMTMLTVHSNNRCEKCGYEFREINGINQKHADDIERYNSAISERNDRLNDDILRATGLDAESGQALLENIRSVFEKGGLKAVAAAVSEAVKGKETEDVERSGDQN